MAWAMLNPLVAPIVRSSPDTTPVLRLRLYWNGSPITASPSPTDSDLELPSVSGWRVRPEGSTFSRAMSDDWSWPSTLAVRVVPSWNVTVIEDAPATTWAAVRMRPWPSMTDPLPAAVVCDWLGGPKGPPPWPPAALTPRAVMSTTPAAELAYSAFALSPEGVPDPLEAERRSTTLVEFVEPPSAPTAASSPVTAPALSSAAHSATATRAVLVARRGDGGPPPRRRASPASWPFSGLVGD